MESIKRTISITGDTVLSDEAIKLIKEAGFKAMGGQYINYKTTTQEVYALSIALHDLDLHLDTISKWNYGKLITSLSISQGYPCKICGGLDIKPDLSCSKTIV
jgi:hypothetical protein